MKKTKKHDRILIILLLTAAVFGWILLETGRKNDTIQGMAVVTVDGVEYGRYPLTENLTERIELSDTAYNVLEIHDGMADVTEASCPDKVCVKHRRIKKDKESIVCLPNQVMITIEHGAASDVDSMTH